jgi:hypothetical protein
MVASSPWAEPAIGVGCGVEQDPLKLSKTDDKFIQYRCAEVKHGRVAMLACLDYFVKAAGYKVCTWSARDNRGPNHGPKAHSHHSMDL